MNVINAFLHNIAPQIPTPEKCNKIKKNTLLLDVYLKMVKCFGKIVKLV